eukprot:GHRR01032715.1.p1 GENE.GHRR01032715.1~~GHRR01032715.1.p1  ORF type:complete len:208 (-),score=2.24 GHRR01032715.1:58-681(-)
MAYRCLSVCIFYIERAWPFTMGVPVRGPYRQSIMAMYRPTGCSVSGSMEFQHAKPGLLRAVFRPMGMDQTRCNAGFRGHEQGFVAGTAWSDDQCPDPFHCRVCSADSLISRLNLVCSDAWKVQMTNSITFAGCFIGSGLFGALCDRFGRRMPMLIATAIMAVANFVSLAAPNYWFMAIARAIIGLGAAGQSLCVFLLCTEITGPSYR